MIRVVLPFHLRTLAQVNSEISLQVVEPITLRTVLDALEAAYPMLRGTVRDLTTKERRAFIRFFACGQDFSDEPIDAALPTAIATGTQPLRIVGALAGG